MPPPDDTVDCPANTVTLPPLSVLPAPTVTRTEPALPFVDAPVPTEILPLLPTLAVPELKLSRPDTPLSPLHWVWIVIDPLDVDDPVPLASAIAPPEVVRPSPAVANIAPPFPLAAPLP